MTSEAPPGLVDAKLAWVEWRLDKDLNVWITIETIHGARSRPKLVANGFTPGCTLRLSLGAKKGAPGVFSFKELMG